jgi:hypothetical protein
MERLTWIGSIHFSSQQFVGSSEKCRSSIEAASSATLRLGALAVAARCLHPDPQHRAWGILLAWGCGGNPRGASCGTRRRRGAGWRRHHSNALPPAEKKGHRCCQPPSADPHQLPPSGTHRITRRCGRGCGGPVRAQRHLHGGAGPPPVASRGVRASSAVGRGRRNQPGI